MGKTPHHGFFKLSRVRTELHCLRIVPSGAPHPVQPNGEFAGHGHFGDTRISAHCQV